MKYFLTSICFLIIFSSCFAQESEKDVKKLIEKMIQLGKNLSYLIEKNAPVFKGFKYCGQNENSHLREYRHIKTGMIFVLLPGNKEVDPFLISKYETTQEVWKKIMNTNPSQLKKEDHPVERVTYYEILSFCQRTNLDLPSLKQWQYAYRGGASRDLPYFWGFTHNANYSWNEKPWNKGKPQHKAVGKLLPNGFGLYDMAGNVWELIDREVSQAGIIHLCGGAWNSPAEDCKVDSILKANSSDKLNRIGFRCISMVPFQTIMDSNTMDGILSTHGYRKGYAKGYKVGYNEGLKILLHKILSQKGLKKEEKEKIKEVYKKLLK